MTVSPMANKTSPPVSSAASLIAVISDARSRWFSSIVSPSSHVPWPETRPSWCKVDIRSPSVHLYLFPPGSSEPIQSAQGDAGSMGAMGRNLAVRETVILLHPPLHLAGVSIGMERGCSQNGRTLADGHMNPGVRQCLF